MTLVRSNPTSKRTGTLAGRGGGRKAAGARTYLFMASTTAGGRRFGLRRAKDSRQLVQTLRTERLVPLKTWPMPAWVGGESDIGLKDQAEIHFVLGQLLSRGVPLVEALEVTSTSVSPGVRPRVDRMRELVASGASFSDACQAVESFDPVTIAVYRAAERTGDLAGAAKQLSLTVRRQLAISGKAITLLIYPAIVLSISIAVSLLMIAVIVPKIASALASNNAELPAVTVALWKTGDFIRENALLLLLGALAAGVAAFLVRKTLIGLLMGVLRRLPLVRGLVLAQEITRFFTVMAAMSRSGVTLADALGVAVGAVNHPELRSQLVRLRTRLVEGGILKNLIQDVDAFPITTRRLMIAAERSGDLQAAFDTLAQDMVEEVDKRSSRLLAALEPMLILIMFLMIGSLLLSVMIPLMKIASSAVQ
ncbi:MAG TPA: type II secretion system F family protein [Phycisphaerales bacterium]|nr:type II secretion system F family protein [Phycisphaerales bacterium]